MNNISDDELAALMYAETDNPPPSRVDLAWVIHDGQRRRRRRRLVTPAVTIAIVAVLSVGVAVAGNVASTSQLRSPAEPGTASSLSVQADAPAKFDPLRLHVAAGWVPEGLTSRPPILGQTAQQIWFSDVMARAGNHAGEWVDVTLYASGITPWQLATSLADERPRPTVSPAPAMRGQTARWITYDHPDYDNGLAWKWAPNAWVVVRAHLADETQQQTVARRVAENLDTNADQPVLLPFTVDAPPAPLRLVKVEVREEPPWYSYTLEFGLKDSARVPFPIDTAGEVHDTLIVSLTRREPGAERKPEPDRIIAGHPAAVRFDSTTYGSVDLYDVTGHEVTVYVTNADGLRVIGEDQAVALALSVVPLGKPTDRSVWTSTPVG